MPNYKLTYFNARGFAEYSRYMFEYAGVPYEDDRINKEDWPSLKEKQPFGQLPVLDVDGVKISQSYAIAVYVAKICGLMGKNELEEARIHMMCQCMNDTVKPMWSFFQEADATRKAELKKKFEEEQLPTNLKLLNRLLVENGGGDGYFVGNSMTMADIFLARTLDFPGHVDITINPAGIEKLFALKKKVESEPKIAAWIKRRPVTET